MQWRRCKVITRDFLMNADCKTAFGAIEESLLWSAEQRAASLAATLACRPDEGPVWIFGYGSLKAGMFRHWSLPSRAPVHWLDGIARFACA